MFENETYDEEVCGYGDEKDGKGSQQAVHSYPEEEVEQANLQEIVEYVGSNKSCSVLLWGFLAEGEVSRQVVVEEETDEIADGIGHIDIDPVL